MRPQPLIITCHWDSPISAVGISLPSVNVYIVCPSPKAKVHDSKDIPHYKASTAIRHHCFTPCTYARDNGASLGFPPGPTGGGQEDSG